MEKACEEMIQSWRDMLDVPLAVNVELGRTTLSMQEILDLEEGSVVQLPRSTGEGVVVLADDRTLVRGEIIVIEDRAGVRVTEILAEDK
ncbi:MAG TPA: FliM/FliN family flagellar motor switch protein [Pyrinomonadaceae bacterium]|jgi:flagellar motor switch protein FliN/FliY|nr:FliM/FliN family flagellar motor switch protein [Pyrinomonadaceae bacterium]